MPNWENAPIVESPAKGGKWQDAPVVGGEPSAQPSGDMLAGIGRGFQSAQSGAMQGMTFGFGDEINAGLMTVPEMISDAIKGKGFDPGRSYNQALEFSREQDRAAAESNPAAFTAGQIAGGVGSGIGLSKGGLTLMAGAKPTMLSMGARGALEGAGYGALQGFGSGEDMPDRVDQAVKGGLWGGAIGGVTGGVAGALANKAAQGAVPSVEELKSQAGALYDSAKASGAMLPQNQAADMALKVRGIASSEGIVTPTGRINESFPKIADLVRSFDDYGTGNLTVEQMQSVRKLIQNALKSPDADERRIAMMMMETFHGYLDPLAPQISQANQIYHRAMNADVLQTLIEVAQQKSGQYGRSMDVTLREQFGALERQIIKGQVRGFSEAEKAAISKVAQGGSIENVLTLIGRAAPSGIVSAGAGFGVPFAVGNAVGGPVAGTMAGLGTMGAGLGARQAATAMTLNNARVAAALAKSGGAPLSMANSAIPGITQALIAGEATQAPKIPQQSQAVMRALIGMSQ